MTYLRAPKGIDARLEELSELVASGHSYGQVARLFGCDRASIGYWARKLGIRSAHQSKRTQSTLVRINGVDYSLSQAARAFDVSWATVWWRYQHGYRGRDLVVRRLDQREVYEYGLTAGELAEYRELIGQYDEKYAAQMLGWPLGAVRACAAGQDHRFE